MDFRHTLPFPVLLLALFFAATLPIAQAVELTPSATNLTETPIKCTKIRPFKFRPHFGDCIKAIKELPDTTTEGEFHCGSRMDGFQLPVTEGYGGCVVSVDLGYSRQRDVTSWYHIKNAALRIATSCWTSIGGSLGPTGGTVQIGDRELIYIAVVKRGSSMDVGNLTVTTENGTAAMIESN